MKCVKLLCACVLLACGAAVRANVPDSVYLFSFAAPDGTGGLRLAWGTDGRNWRVLDEGKAVVSSDFGPWGSMKRMYDPVLWRSEADGLWRCCWKLSPKGDGVALTSSPDLVKWMPQRYADGPMAVVPTVERRSARVDGKDVNGCVNRVAYSHVEGLRRYAESRALRDGLWAETMAMEPRMEPFGARLRVMADSVKPISPLLTGIFFEDINYAADGGLYAELVQNRDFEYSPVDNLRKPWTSSYAWTLLDGQGREGAMRIDSVAPLHENNRHYALLGAGCSLVNSGWDGIAVKQGERYRLTLFARRAAGRGAVKLAVSIRRKSGEVLASGSVAVKAADWKKYTVVLTAKGDASDARLCVSSAEGEAALDMVSLFPFDTFRGRPNGLRRDLAETLEAMKPRFIRFPGGCVAHGNGVDNIYDWKGSVGPLEARRPLRNIWNYHQTRGLGYYEFFQFCEDIGAEPLPVLAAGVPCQNSGIPAHHSHSHVSSYGQQGGIPMEEMGAYVQDVLDLIEWANGDARTSKWARMRAEAGHPKPFGLKYLGIGNEDMITDVFEERFKMIADAVKAAHPEITIVGTAGPFNEGSDYERGWAFATEQQIPMIDEHYYVSPGWLIHNNDFYDNYDRSKPKVYLGEYAAHLPGRPNNIETALAEAIYLTGVERNGDVVSMSSYAPLLAKEKHTQWNPDLIYFTNTEVKPTPGYYVQQLYGQNAGTEYVTSELTLDTRSPWAKPRVGASVVRDGATGDCIVKLANLNPAEVDMTLSLGKLVGQMMTVSVLTGAPTDRKAAPSVSERVLSPEEISSGEVAVKLPAHSFTVLRMRGITAR